MTASGQPMFEHDSVLGPLDEFNSRLLENVRPANWLEPVPPDRYNLVVIGAGTAGLVTAAGAAGLGAKVALVEKKLLGGDCLNVGCVPSKAILRAARAVAEFRKSAEFGIQCGPVTVDFPAVMQRMRLLRASISPNDSAQRFRKLGVDIYFGQAQFVDGESVQVGSTTLRFRKAVLATGSLPAVPPIPGINEVGFLTNETVFSLTHLPRRLAVIGAGPIGCELAQAFARFGSKVYLIETAHGILPKEDRDAAIIVQRSLESDGVQLLCCGKSLEAQAHPQGKRLLLHSHDQHHDLVVDEILIATGRKPNVDDLALERAGVDYNANGIRVDDFLCTTNRHIYAAGDCCSAWKFTHAADALARIVIQNALFFGRARASKLVIPWCTYTDPEIAHVGLYEEQAIKRGLKTEVFEQSFAHVDRAVLDGDQEGFVRILVKKGTDKILGATVVSAHAGEMISEIALAMTAGIGLRTISRSIHPYPTQTEAIKKVGDHYNRSRLTPRLHSLLTRWFTWLR